MSDPPRDRRTSPDAGGRRPPHDPHAASEPDAAPEPSAPKPRGDRRASPATAGALLLGTTLLCAGVGFALGAAVGLPVPFGLLGFFAGLALGFVVVYSRFKDI